MLPGEADAAEDLDAVLRVGDGRVEGDGGRARHRKRVPPGSRVPRQRFGRFGAAEHFGAQVLDRLEAADGLAELLADLRVLDGDGQAATRHSRRLGRSQGRRQRHDRRQGQQVGTDAGEPDARQRAREVERLQRLDGHPGRPRREQHVAAADRHHQPGSGGGSRRRPADAVVERHLVEQHRHRGLPLGDRCEQFLRLGHLRQQEAAERGTEHWTGNEFFGRGGQSGGEVGEGPVGAAGRGGQRDAEQPEPGEARGHPGARPGFRRTHRFSRVVRGGPGVDRLGQRGLFLGERDRHGPSSRYGTVSAVADPDGSHGGTGAGERVGSGTVSACFRPDRQCYSQV